MTVDTRALALVGWLGGALVFALGCDPITALRPDLPDAGTEAEGCDEVTPAARVLATNCAVSGACHVPGGQYPDLSRAGLESVVGAPSRTIEGETLIVPGDPEASFLYRKVAGTQGPDGGRLMPIGTDEPLDTLPVLEAWIRGGAPTRCDSEQALPTPPPDPNNLNPDELFTCGDAPGSSPARLRRIDRIGWTHAIGQTTGSTAHDNPFYAPEGSYSTYAAGATIDTATLDLYFLSLPYASIRWAQQSSSPRLYDVYSDRELRCIFDQTTPSEECIDYYVDRMLERGVLFRTPTEDERSRIHAELIGRLENETSLDDRLATLRHVVSAAWLMSGALFRSEMGGEEADADGRRRLTDDELSQALGALLNTHPVGSSLPEVGDQRPPEPDRSAPESGWLGRIRAAARDGRIQDPEVIRELLRTYRGGIDPDRADIAVDTDPRDVPSRGEHWLAPRVAGFFREYFDYEAANSIFKDSPAETSAWEDVRTAELGFGNLQRGYYGYESTLVQQLDDTIARTVLDAESAGSDVYAALFTTRLWRLPSNLAMSNGEACSSDADCDAFTSHPRCQEDVGLCASQSSNGTISTHRLYGLTENVPATQEGRWVTMAEGERAGVLTHPAWLAAHGGNFEDDASAVRRGRWIREHLYCETVPGLELVRVEAQLVESSEELRARDRMRVSMEEGEQGPRCMGCHQLMNPLGLPFEIFNHAGFPRVDDHGQPPDGSSTLGVGPDPSLEGEVEDAIEYAQQLSESPYARRCFVRHVFRYFMGRDETLQDACALSEMETAFEGGSFFAMLEALATSDAFLYRVREVSP